MLFGHIAGADDPAPVASVLVARTVAQAGMAGVVAYPSPSAQRWTWPAWRGEHLAIVGWVGLALILAGVAAMSAARHPDK